MSWLTPAALNTARLPAGHEARQARARLAGALPTREELLAGLRREPNLGSALRVIQARLALTAGAIERISMAYGDHTAHGSTISRVLTGTRHATLAVTAGAAIAIGLFVEALERLDGQPCADVEPFIEELLNELVRAHLRQH